MPLRTITVVEDCEGFVGLGAVVLATGEFRHRGHFWKVTREGPGYVLWHRRNAGDPWEGRTYSNSDFAPNGGTWAAMLAVITDADKMHTAKSLGKQIDEQALSASVRACDEWGMKYRQAMADLRYAQVLVSEWKDRCEQEALRANSAEHVADVAQSNYVNARAEVDRLREQLKGDERVNAVKQDRDEALALVALHGRDIKRLRGELAEANDRADKYKKDTTHNERVIKYLRNKITSARGALE